MASIADVIHQHGAEIMACWCAEVRASASARGLSATALETVMPLYLSALADQTETGQVDAVDRRHQRVHNHLATRLRQGFDLAEIVGEIAALGRCIAKVWQALPEAQWPSAADVDRLHAQLHVAIADVTRTFHRHMLEDEQSEKRFLRRLQEIASDALQDAGRPLSERVRDLLEVVMEAVDGQAAAFLLHDPARAKLVLVASVGGQPVEPYETSLDPKSFAGTVAGHEEPTTIEDISSTQLEVPEVVRRSGIRGLIGVRLPARGDLNAILYVGISGARTWTSREIGLVEALVERVGLYRHNARLYDELREKIAALDVEKALRERFVSMLAHDLRGPLSAARLAADLMALQAGSLEESRELASKVDRSIDRADRMISDLLDANRIRAGEQLPLRPEPCELATLAEQVAEEARALHGDRFVVEADAPVHGIWSPRDLHRALWNLVTNAVKYGAANQPIVLSVTRDGETARISVHNAGLPISSADQAKIFDAYSRVPDAEGGGGVGWGLGLALVRGTAEAHGGRASVTSDPESGTTFTIELPLEARPGRGTAARAASTFH